MVKTKTILKFKGGPGSGHFGHVGRPGARGGSKAGMFGTTVDADGRKKRRLNALLKSKGIQPKELKKASEQVKDTINITGVGYYGDPQQVFAGSGYKGDIADVAETAFVMRDEASGLSTEIFSIKSDYTGVTVKGRIKSPDGKNVGGFIRKFKDDGEVHHDTFMLDEDYQNTGFATRFYQNSELTYLTAGAKQVTLYANISVGGYAWARMGFNAQKPDVLENYREKVYNRAKLAVPANQWRAYESTIMNANMWDIASFTYNDERIGKNVLLGSDWMAVKNLDPNDEGFIVGQLYYQTKGQ